MDKKFVGDEVKEFRAKFQEVGYSFDRSRNARPGVDPPRSKRDATAAQTARRFIKPAREQLTVSAPGPQDSWKHMPRIHDPSTMAVTEHGGNRRCPFQSISLVRSATAAGSSTVFSAAYPSAATTCTRALPEQ